MSALRTHAATWLLVALLVGVGLLSAMAGLQLTSYLNHVHRQQKFVAYTAQVREVNSLMDSLEARFDISRWEMRALRNKTRHVASLIKDNLDTNR